MRANGRLRARWMIVGLVGMLLLAGAPWARAAQQCFEETQECLDGRFEQYWQQHGGLPVFGFAISAAANARSADMDRDVMAQWLERNRFELHPQNQPPYDVLLGRLGDERLRQQGRDWQTFPKADPAVPRYFAATGHAIAHEPFWSYWSSHGLEFDGRRGFSEAESLALWGLPLSEPAMETNGSGDRVLTQWFERARFEDHGAGGVKIGLLGSEVTGYVGKPAPTAFDLNVQEVARGFERPLFLTHAGDGSGRVFVVEKSGTIRTLDGAIFLDIRDRVRATGGEQGLLGLAFHPRFRDNGYLYVNYTDANGSTVIARFTAPGDRRTADVTTEARLLLQEQPAANHNGGMLAFGPDGYLYIALGDGGGANDTFRNAQNRRSLLGKLLRIDVDGGSPYAIPPSNPFAGDTATRPEIWAYGLRNPWRFSFDRANGDLYIADVGQDRFEWIHFQGADNAGGQNYGWPIVEGAACLTGSQCDQRGLTLPVAVYDHDLGCSVTGGYVYRGTQFEALVGNYVVGDFCTGQLWTLRRNTGGAWQFTPRIKTNIRISSFGEDEAGELYLTDLAGGRILRVTATTR